MTTLMVSRNMSKSTIRAPPTRASIEGMFGYSTAVLDDILDFLPPALPRVGDRGNRLGETILIQSLRELGFWFDQLDSESEQSSS